MYISAAAKNVQKAGFQCHGCTDRYPGCHDKCEKYRKSLNKYRALEREADRVRAKPVIHADWDVATRYKENGINGN